LPPPAAPRQVPPGIQALADCISGCHAIQSGHGHSQAETFNRPSPVQSEHLAQPAPGPTFSVLKTMKARMLTKWVMAALAIRLITDFAFPDKSFRIKKEEPANLFNLPRRANRKVADEQ
jgi:hypothetical protein